jgi:hypothetical protein
MKIPGDHDFLDNFSSKTNFMTDCREDSRTGSKIDKHHQIILLK